MDMGRIWKKINKYFTLIQYRHQEVEIIFLAFEKPLEIA